VKYLGVGLIVFATWYLTSDHYQNRITEIQLRTAEATQTELLAAAAKQKTAEEQHAQDQLDINALNGKLSKRVRVHIPVCISGPQTSEDSDRETRILSERVDEAFEQLRAEVGDLFARCDQLNIDAIQSNNSQ
jgi:peptide deformylase